MSVFNVYETISFSFFTKKCINFFLDPPQILSDPLVLKCLPAWFTLSSENQDSIMTAVPGISTGVTLPELLLHRRS